ncbi:4-alpha-glucanotransferase [Dehalogenimonas alkenigignens]|uniref:4-alpha-glucanotransferase n=1 Tax=Dehalogenimonas alkenigignens TaxID=1217799 RepID=UPI000E307BBC|nr:4-alpha-glucanotransferase [Dehalogenimonas alkenigignens]
MAKVNPELNNLATACGIQTAYRDMHGRLKRASAQAIIGALRGLGIRIEDETDAPQAFRRLTAIKRRQAVQPVLVAWSGRLRSIPMTLPRKFNGIVSATITLEEGRVLNYCWKSSDCTVTQIDHKQTKAYQRTPTHKLQVKGILPQGYHELKIHIGTRMYRSLIISAPQQAYSDKCDSARWGLFSPVYSLRSETSLGAGDLSDFRRLAGWSETQGASVIATLPLLPIILEDSSNPSPYSPVSRLFWNEFYIDLESLPELAACGEARELLHSQKFAAEAENLRESALVNYGQQGTLKRQVLELLSRYFFSNTETPRYQEFSAFMVAHPEALEYARFRASKETGQTSSQISPGDDDTQFSSLANTPVGYYLFTQFSIQKQLERLYSELSVKGIKLFLDLPLGTHPEGWDARRFQDDFTDHVSVGAPPDPVFPSGQNWGFRPPHPERMRLNGYNYFIQVLRHHFQFGKILRLDHIMWFHRLFWIPLGLNPSEGLYIHYRAEELYAVVCLESFRNKAVVVGEDLGLVPAEVRRYMRRRGILRSFVAQYEMLSGNGNCFAPVPNNAAASMNTHDMHPFTAFFNATDIAERTAAGVLGPAAAKDESTQRKNGITSMLECLRGRGFIYETHPSADAVYRVFMRLLASGSEPILLLNIADLLGDYRAQNIPGTVNEYPNWRILNLRSIEEIQTDPRIIELIRDVAVIRARRTKAVLPAGSLHD